MRAGQDPARLPDLSLREAMLVVDAARERDEELAHRQAVYMAWAYHQPNDMPEPGASKARAAARPEGVNTEADVVAVKAWMRAVARGPQNGS